jgi:hypothetical protein
MTIKQQPSRAAVPRVDSMTERHKVTLTAEELTWILGRVIDEADSISRYATLLRDVSKEGRVFDTVAPVADFKVAVKDLGLALEYLEGYVHPPIDEGGG